MRIIGFIILFYSIAFNIEAQEVKFEQTDKERLVRVEVKLDESIKSIQTQIDDLKQTTQKQIDDLKQTTQKQTDDLRAFLLWGFGILFGERWPKMENRRKKSRTRQATRTTRKDRPRRNPCCTLITITTLSFGCDQFGFYSDK